jgi:hypothetical protein
VVFVIAVDDLLWELKESLLASREVIKYRVRWIVLEKLRSFWR